MNSSLGAVKSFNVYPNCILCFTKFTFANYRLYSHTNDSKHDCYSQCPDDEDDEFAVHIKVAGDWTGKHCIACLFVCFQFVFEWACQDS